MAEVKKQSTVAALTQSYQRVKAQADKAKETGTMLARELVTTGEAFAISTGAGFADEYWGELDATTGLRIHKTSGVPTTLIAAAGLKIAGALGVFGEFQRDAFAAGTGTLCHDGSGQGRGIAMRLRASRDKAQAESVKTEAKAA